MLFHQNDSLFLRMWSAQPASPHGTQCWDVDVRSGDSSQPGRFFDEALRGPHCSTSNWVEGHTRGLGGRHDPTRGPPLFGFDDAIAAFCRERGGFGNSTAESCTRAGFNILALSSKRLPWSVCRNLEWQLCAATGRLPGQQSAHVIFATPPATGSSVGAPLGQCLQAPGEGSGGAMHGWTNNDVFYLEICLFWALCEQHGDALFRLRAGEPFLCHVSTSGLHALEQRLRFATVHSPPSPKVKVSDCRHRLKAGSTSKRNELARPSTQRLAERERTSVVSSLSSQTRHELSSPVPHV